VIIHATWQEGHINNSISKIVEESLLINSF